MSDAVHDLEKLTTAWALATSSDLSGLFGLEVTISAGPIVQVARSDALPEADTIVCSRCQIADEAAGPLWFVLPLRGAMAIAAAGKGAGADDFEAFASQPFEGEVADAHRDALELCAGILGRVFDEEADLPGVQLEESRLVDRDACDEVLPDGSYRRVHFEVELAGLPATAMELLIGSGTAEKWFGALESSSEASDGRSLGQKIAVIDPSPESREAFGEIAQSLGAQVMSIDPNDLGPDVLEDLANVAWVVLTWDLGGRSGLDVLDRLRRNESTSHLAFAVASEAPTRSMFEAAIRWGARTLLYQPWDADEVLDRLSRSD